MLNPFVLVPFPNFLNFSNTAFSHWRLTHCQTQTQKHIIHFFQAAQNRDNISPKMSLSAVMYCTYHSAQAMFLHQPEGVLVTGGEVVGLSWAHMTSGHRAHGVDHICEGGRHKKLISAQPTSSKVTWLAAFLVVQGLTQCLETFELPAVLGSRTKVFRICKIIIKYKIR